MHRLLSIDENGVAGIYSLYFRRLDPVTGACLDDVDPILFGLLVEAPGPFDVILYRVSGVKGNGPRCDYEAVDQNRGAVAGNPDHLAILQREVLGGIRAVE